MISPGFLQLLRCPTTGQTLALADAELLAKANARLEAGGAGATMAAGGSGDPSGAVLTEALVRADRQVLYPIQDGIPVLLAEAAVML